MAKQQWTILFATFVISAASLSVLIVSFATTNWVSESLALCCVINKYIIIYLNGNIGNIQMCHKHTNTCDVITISLSGCS